MKQSVKNKKAIIVYVTLVLVGTTLGRQTVWAEGDNDEVYVLPDVVVTATRTEKNINKVPASVTILQGEDLQERHQDNLGDALRIVPGVQFDSYGSGAGYSNTLRMNGSNNVLFMVDGITMNATGVNPPLTMMRNMDGIDRVEVVRGAASTLYGSGAIGGVINMITRVPDEGMRTTVRTIGGSYDQEQYKVINEGKEGNLYWRASYQKDLMGSYKDAHGLTIPQRLDGHTASFMVGGNVDSKNNVMFSYDSYRAGVKYADSNASLFHIRHNSEANDSFRGIWKSTINDRLSHQLYVVNNHYDISAKDAMYGDYDTEIHTKAIGDQITYNLGKHIIIGGFDWHQDKVDSQNGVKLTNSSYYVQDEWQFASKWTLIPGFRVDHHSAFGTNTSPHISLAYDVNDKTNVYVSYNEYFLAPTAYQLYGLYGANKNLKPETGYEIDFGVHHQFDDTLLGNMNFFVRHAEDKIGYDTKSLNNMYENFDKEDSYGLSVDLYKQITSHLSAKAAYTYTHVDATSARSANLDGYVPKHAVNVSLDYNASKWDAHLDVRGVIDRPGRSVSADKGDFFPKSTYWITNISANYRITDDITVFGRVNNIFDVYYAEMSNVSYGSARDWWTMPGRNYQLGLEMTF